MLTRGIKFVLFAVFRFVVLTAGLMASSKLDGQTRLSYEKRGFGSTDQIRRPRRREAFSFKISGLDERKFTKGG
jgi:hypothetical protein